MIEKLIMSESSIPDGILHDQALHNISLDGNVLTLSFKTHLFSDYVGNEFCEKYKNFTKCHIKCRLEDEYFCSAQLKTSVNKKDEYKVKILSVSEFAQLAAEQMKKENDGAWEYIHTYISPNIRSALIELSIWLKYGGTEYTMCTLELNTEKIEYIWALSIKVCKFFKKLDN